MNEDKDNLKAWIDYVMIDEWWSDGNEAFYKYGERLLERGCDLKFIKSMFLDLYHASVKEYGG